jgi:hypothetical protein
MRILLIIALWNTGVAWINIKLLHTIHWDGTICNDYHQYLPIAIPLVISTTLGISKLIHTGQIYLRNRRV